MLKYKRAWRVLVMAGSGRRILMRVWQEVPFSAGERRTPQVNTTGCALLRIVKKSLLTLQSMHGGGSLGAKHVSRLAKMDRRLDNDGTERKLKDSDASSVPPHLNATHTLNRFQDTSLCSGRTAAASWMQRETCTLLYCRVTLAFLPSV